MNNDEAKFLLHGYRPSGRDAGDPQFAEALAQARNDPQLGAWLAEQQEVDTAIGQQLRDCPVPPELKTSILAGRKILSTAGWRQRAPLLALAASLVFLAILAGWWLAPDQSSPLEAFRQDLTKMLTAGAYRLQAHSEDVGELQAWLRANGGHADFALPAGIASARGHGCQVLDWRGKKVTMLCLRTSQAGIVHLFIIERSDLSEAPAPGVPKIDRAGEWTTAFWSGRDKAYLLVALADRATLEKIL